MSSFLALEMAALIALGGKRFGSRSRSLTQMCDQADAVVFVVDGEGRPVAEAMGLATENPDTSRVEGRDPHGPGGPADQTRDPGAHLVGRLVGEGDGEDRLRRYVEIADQVGDAVSEDPGLAGPGSGHHQDRSFGGCHRFSLAGIEIGQQRRVDQKIVLEPHSRRWYRDAGTEITGK